MDEFGFEPRYARLAAGEAGAAGAEGQPDGDPSPRQSSATAAPAQQQQQQRRRQTKADNMSRPRQEDDRLKVRPRSEPEDSVPLPQAFTAQFLGSRPAAGLWGVRHTRRPVDELVSAARASSAPLPLQRLRVSEAGVDIMVEGNASDRRVLRHHDIAAISYGVQDLVYTRVFCFIVVSDQKKAQQQQAAAGAPVFQCHAYVCESRAAARALTHALAAAFRAFSRAIRQAGPGAKELVKERFKIDLRPPDQLAADLAIGAIEDSSDA